MRMIENIKAGFLKKKNTAAIQREIKLKSPEQFLSVLVIAENADEHWLKKVADVFKNAEIKSLTRRSKKEDDSPQSRYTVHPADFSLTGLLKNEKLQRLFNTQFELIVDLSEDSGLLNYFLRGTRGHLVIGKLGGPNEQWHDLLLERGDSDDSFLLTIQKQLNLLGHGHRKI